MQEAHEIKESLFVVGFVGAMGILASAYFLMITIALSL